MINFRCKCGGTRLEEVLVGVIKYTEIIDYDPVDMKPIYGHKSYHGGDILYIRCINCSKFLRDKYGNIVTDYVDFDEVVPFGESLAIKIDADLSRQIKSIADNNGISYNNYVNNLIEEALREDEYEK